MKEPLNLQGSLSLPRKLLHTVCNGYVQEQAHALNELREIVNTAEADLLTPNGSSGTIYLVHAAVHGTIQGEAFFHTAEEACTFRDECIAYEATRYSNDAANNCTAEEYKAMRQGFGQRHPWMRFSRGVRFIARSAPIGRPVKVQP